MFIVLFNHELTSVRMLAFIFSLNIQDNWIIRPRWYQWRTKGSWKMTSAPEPSSSTMWVKSLDCPLVKISRICSLSLPFCFHFHNGPPCLPIHSPSLRFFFPKSGQLVLQPASHPHCTLTYLGAVPFFYSKTTFPLITLGPFWASRHLSLLFELASLD